MDRAEIARRRMKMIAAAKEKELQLGPVPPKPPEDRWGLKKHLVPPRGKGNCYRPTGGERASACGRMYPMAAFVVLPRADLEPGADAPENVCSRCLQARRKIRKKKKEAKIAVHLRSGFGNKTMCGLRSVDRKFLRSGLQQILLADRRPCRRCVELVLAHISPSRDQFEVGDPTTLCGIHTRHLVREPTDLVRMCPDCLRLWAEAARRQSAQG